MTLKVVFTALLSVGGMNRLPKRSPAEELRSKRTVLLVVILLGSTTASENSHEGHSVPSLPSKELESTTNGKLALAGNALADGSSI